MSDEGFREFQLNGKQLVFMFMAVTASAVVIFLCGVMVGRGVRAPGVTDPVQTTATTPSDPTAGVGVSTPSATALPNGAPPSAQETLTYPDRLEEATPPPETLEEPAPEINTASTTPPPAKGP